MSFNPDPANKPLFPAAHYRPVEPLPNSSVAQMQYSNLNANTTQRVHQVGYGTLHPSANAFPMVVPAPAQPGNGFPVVVRVPAQNFEGYAHLPTTPPAHSSTLGGHNYKGLGPSNPHLSTRPLFPASDNRNYKN